MPATYCLEVPCGALSCRPAAEPHTMRAYVRVYEEEAVRSVLDLLKQGLSVGAILDHIGEERIAKHFRSEAW